MGFLPLRICVAILISSVASLLTISPERIPHPRQPTKFATPPYLDGCSRLSQPQPCFSTASLHATRQSAARWAQIRRTRQLQKQCRQPALSMASHVNLSGGDEHSTHSHHHHHSPHATDSQHSVLGGHREQVVGPPRLPKGGLEVTDIWRQLQRHAAVMKRTHLRNMLNNQERVRQLFVEHDGVAFDFARQKVSLKTMELLISLAQQAGVEEKIRAMFRGEKINNTERRAVLHTLLRAERGDSLMVDGVDYVPQVWKVLDKVKGFSEDIRSGTHRGATGRRIKNFIVVGIGGSSLGPAVLHEALHSEPNARAASKGLTLRFLSNIDPHNLQLATEGLDPEETMVVVVSKTFTTVETMMNARNLRSWLWSAMGCGKEVVEQHMVACSTNMELVEQFGISTDLVFIFWDWVGGRYSVCSAVGALPISLQYGFSVFEEFLEGARTIDKHFQTAPPAQNIPVLMAMLGIWNLNFLDCKVRALFPYSEALKRLPAHIQQVEMESNGKRVNGAGEVLRHDVGEIVFGEPGTNGQHSFFQLLHMGTVIPADFLGFIETRHNVCMDGEQISNHDELMANFLSQPDALASGKTVEELMEQGVDDSLIPHRTFPGDRPSNVLLFPRLDARNVGKLLAMYEHRTAVQGFVWDINSFDQWGVELGKKLASDIRQKLVEHREKEQPHTDMNLSTQRLFDRYLHGSAASCMVEEEDMCKVRDVQEE